MLLATSFYKKSTVLVRSGDLKYDFEVGKFWDPTRFHSLTKFKYRLLRDLNDDNWRSFLFNCYFIPKCHHRGRTEDTTERNDTDIRRNHFFIQQWRAASSTKANKNMDPLIHIFIDRINH
jgi:hypothetical protein